MRKLHASILLMTALAAAGPALAQQKVDERRPAARDAQVKIENIAGDVTVTGWDKEEVTVTGTLGKGTVGLEITGDRDRIEIEVKLPEHGKHVDVEGSSLAIHVPRQSRLAVQTVSADIDLSEFGGDADLESVSGKVRVVGSPGAVEVSTVSGAIDLRTKETLEAGDFKSVSGDISVEADLGTGGRFRLETVSGGIVLRPLGSVSADFEVSSFSGSIVNEFGQQPKKSNPYLPSQELEFTLGGGGARVSVQTLSGRIQLKQ